MNQTEKLSPFMNLHYIGKETIINKQVNIQCQVVLGAKIKCGIVKCQDEGRVVT